MTLDSSALVAILRAESDARDLLETAREADTLRVGSPTLLETAIVVGPARSEDLEALLDGLRVEIVPFGPEHVRVAREAYARFGRGSESKARLNYGDVMSYAVAVVSGEPLLFKGDDFSNTDVTAAV